jgi:hypothetical protein
MDPLLDEFWGANLTVASGVAVVLDIPAHLPGDVITQAIASFRSRRQVLS